MGPAFFTCVAEPRMKNLVRLLAFLLVLLSSIAVEGAQTPLKDVSKQPSWSQLSPEQQKILAPIEKEWIELPDDQRQRLIAAAKRYPKMTAAEQERFTKRLPVMGEI